MILPATLLATVLFGLNTTEAERQETLKSFFNPPPHTILQISSVDLKTSNRTNLKKMRGFITVSPPIGSCFVVTRDQTIPGDYICKKTSLAFDLTDIDQHGKLSWEVKTSPDDTGTVVSWPTPYRRVIAIPKNRNEPAITKEKKPEDFWQSEPPKYLMIESCRDISNEFSRRIELKLFTGESWRFYFPFKHRFLPQPDEISNLAIANSGEKRSLSDAANDKNKEPAKDSGQGEAPPEKKVEAVAKDEKPNNYEDRKSWTIPLRDSYEMSSENFHPNNTNTSGDQGRCRYNFAGPEEDPMTGRIECQNTPEYHMLLIPVTCIEAVKGDKDKP